MIRFILFVLLVAVPIAEIAVFLLVGSAIGVLPTILLIILTAVLGTILLRRQGVSALTRLQSDLRQNKVPAAAIGQAMSVAVAGILLLTPGFITDAIGLALFIPGVRRGLWKSVAGSVRMERPAGAGPRGPAGPGGPARPGGAGGPARGGHGPTIELGEDDYRSADRGADGSSPWRGPPS